ncbi:VIT1/CCC1 transporter family protein [Methylomonas sp. MS20]|uniref:VIT1/CCC1 transporter family protein n=1 Tax=unclassified Methylomonas TaxID=2608980 RepID=UPI0028A2E7F6|nr:VIT family protein [Methylomonas sp. MV1]MDT4330054.1 VIT family protein [Methylomonas sp. MV1]
MKHLEFHNATRIGWLRAAVLGANDGIVSVSSLIIGVAASHADPQSIVVSGVAGLMAGAMSMAAGEYVSVSSQVDTEQADLKREARELAENRHHELNELTTIYVSRGLQPELARQVAEQLMAHDALAAHARDELGLTDIAAARPLQASIVSALTFSLGALLPLSMAMIFPHLPLAPVSRWLIAFGGSAALPLISAVGAISLLALMSLGALSARAGGASVWLAVGRVSFWGMLSMIVTAGVGLLFGAATA